MNLQDKLKELREKESLLLEGMVEDEKNNGTKEEPKKSKK